MKVCPQKSRKLHQSRKKYQSSRTRAEKKILLMLAFFSTSVGLWENFRQLWLQDNGYSASEISQITGLSTLVSVGAIILVGRFLRNNHLQHFMTGILGLKFLNLLWLLTLNQTGQNLLINFNTIIDIITTYLVVTSIYPLVTTVMKSNRAYSKRKLVEYWFRDIGVLIGGILIGQFFSNLGTEYEACLVMAAGCMLMAAIVMGTIKIRITESTHTAKPTPIIKYVAKSRIQVFYLIYAFLAACSFATALGLKMLILINTLSFSMGTATNYLLIVGLISDVIGYYALKYFTPKNDYLTITIKFGIRLGAYGIAILANDPFMSLLAITWSIMISTAYEDVTDGYYINLIDNKHQFSHSTLKHVMSYLGEATGVILCGMMYDYGLAYIFGLSAAIMVVQMGVAYYLINLRKRRRRVRHSASRMRYHESITRSEATLEIHE